jgi:hypothetical protein
MRARRSMGLLFLFVILVALGGCQNPSRLQALRSYAAFEAWADCHGAAEYAAIIEPGRH